MKTLIIHPIDASTNFGTAIYTGLDYTVIRSGSSSFIRQQIKLHDRIVCLGHGTPTGMLRVDGGKFNGFMIDSRTVNFLRGKQNILIWCYAKDFMTKYKLNGYAIGMIISDQNDANYAGLVVPNSDIDISNLHFAQSMRTLLLTGTLGYYPILNSVMEFNYKNM